jgi:hypothetical protein
MSKQEIEIKELSIDFNKRIKEIEKKYNNEFKVMAVIPQWTKIPKEEFVGEEVVKLILVFP